MKDSIPSVRQKDGPTRDIHLNDATTWIMRDGEAADKSKLKEDDWGVCICTFEGNKFKASKVIVVTPQQ